MERPGVGIIKEQKKSEFVNVGWMLDLFFTPFKLNEIKQMPKC